MAMTIGRVTGLRPAPGGVQRNGDRVSIAGSILAATATDLRMAWNQIRGLADNTDEDAVPVTWDVDSTIDGYYRVRTAAVAPIGIEGGKNGRFAIDLDRVGGGYAKPAIEVAFAMAEITNSHGLSERGRVAVPNNGQEVSSNSSLAAATFITTENGPVALLDANPISTPIPRSGVVRYWVAPADYYDGAATLEVLIGSTWYPIVGQQLPSNFTRWRLTNGWFRFGPSATATPFYMQAEGWNGSAWVTVGTFERGAFGGSWTRHDFGASNPTFASIPGASILATPQVLRNGPEVVSIRIPQVFGYETWSLARGDAFVRGFYTDVSVSSGLGVGMSSAIAVTDFVYGMVRTTASSGFKFFAATPSDNTVDAVNGRTYLGSPSTSLAFMIGFSTPTTYGAIDEANWALAATSQRQRVSAR